MSNSQQHDSFFAPSAQQQHSPSQARAREMFGLPGDPTAPARHGIPTQFGDDYDYDESFSYHNQHVEREERMEAMHGDDSTDYAHDDHLGQEASQIQPSSEYAGYETNHDETQNSEQHGDTMYPESEYSSLDPEEDPEAWAERLDEISGKLEMSEAESRALRWGPSIGSQRDDRRIHYTDLHRIVDHHLTNSEWRFTNRSDFQVSAEENPNRVVGRAWIGHEAGNRMDPLDALRQTLLDNGYGSVHL